MDQIVVDCSVTMSWFLKDEYNDYSNDVRKAIEGGVRILVPSLWHIEVANVFLISERRNRITEEESKKGIDAVGKLPVTTDFYGMKSEDVIALARSHRLTSYDALYLELSKREGVPLATLDKKLRDAALKEGVSLFDSPVT